MRILCILIVLVGGFFPAIGQKFTAENGQAKFTSTTPLTTFSGVSNNLTGYLDLESGVVDFYLDLNTLDTGIGLRDKHMRNNYLETKKYPFAEFTGRLDRNISANQLPAEVKVVGKFKLHGVERTVEIPGTIGAEGQGLRVKANWEILLKDYKIDIPKVVFYQLSEKQDVEINILLLPTTKSMN